MWVLISRKVTRLEAARAGGDAVDDRFGGFGAHFAIVHDVVERGFGLLRRCCGRRTGGRGRSAQFGGCG